MTPTRNIALTGSRVGVLGTAGEMSTPAIAIRTASATSAETRFWRAYNTMPSCCVCDLDVRRAIMVALNAAQKKARPRLRGRVR